MTTIATIEPGRVWIGRCRCAGLVVASLTGFIMAATAGPADPGAWSGRSELFWDQAKQILVRRYIRVWHGRQEPELDFFWEANGGAPVPSATVPEVTGAGKLTWFTKGAAYYDPRAMQSVFFGTLANGRAEGHGTLKTRAGLTYDGDWKAGLMDGNGILRMTNGDAYEGHFAAGSMDGTGTYTYANGDVLSGSFSAGRRSGTFLLTRADGTRFHVVWADDREIRRTALDPSLLRQVVDSPGASSPPPMVVTIDQKANQTFAEFDEGDTYRYKAVPHGRDVVVSIDNPDFLAVWKGDGLITARSLAGLGLAQTPKQFAPAYLLIRLPSGRSATDIRKIALKVESSSGSTQPFLDGLGPDFDCSTPTFLPTLLFRNAGWGGITAARISYSFSNEPFSAALKKEAEADGETQKKKAPPKIVHTREFTATTGAFGRFARVPVGEGLKELGFDSEKLPAEKYQKCRDNLSETADPDSCLTVLKDSAALGGLRDVVFAPSILGSQQVMTMVSGRIAYDWLDATKTMHTETHPFNLPLPLFTVSGGSKPTGEYAKLTMGAECGVFEPQRRPVHPAYFSDRKDSYTVDVPLRSKAVRLGPGEIGLAVAAWQPSLHDFKVAFVMKDGQSLESMPIKLDYFVAAKVSQRPK